MRATVVVVTWNGADLLPSCLASLAQQTVPHDVLVVDNASTDGTYALLEREHPRVRVIRLATNTGFAGGAQAGLRAAGSEVVALLNNDAEADPAWLAELLTALDRHPLAAAVTSRIVLRADGRINNAGGGLTRLGVGFDLGYGEPDGPPWTTEKQVAAFSGGAVALRREPALAVGGFEASLFLYYEDTDLSWRLRRHGYEIWYAPAARVVHRHGASSDLHSASFAFHNQHNQLLVLLRNAPAGLVARGVARFLAVTAVDAARWAIGTRPEQPQHRPGHRLRVLRAVGVRLPRTLAQRRRLERAATTSRREVARRWLADVPAAREGSG